MKRHLVLALAVFTFVHANAGTRPPVGGGILDAGLNAEYFANPDLAGEPAFKRKDIRVRFDWGTLLPVAGSTSPEMKDFPTDNFSVRWEGRIMPRFTETYEFKAKWDEGLRWLIRPTGTSEWTTLVDSWDKSGEAAKPHPMKADTSYDVRVEYRDRTGPARVELRWSSPGAPEDLLDCASMNAIGGTSVEATIHADGLRCVSPWSAKSSKDLLEKFPLENWGGDGWYNGDFDPGWMFLRKGRYLLRFAGLAEVVAPKTRFAVAGRAYEKGLPHGVGYDPKSNFTTAEVELIAPEDTRPDRWVFKDSQRDASAPKGSGVRDIRLMRPVTPGSAEYHHPDEVVNRTHKPWLSHYTNLRFYRALGENRWELRTRPGEFDHFAAGSLRNEANKALGGGVGYGCLENYIRYANELGRDLYLTVNGHNPDAEYLRKLALAIRYGTDGAEPYTKPTANPVYPPLNANLRIFIEFSNEIWNYWGGGAQALCKAAIERGDADGKILNYDGKCQPQGDFGRWQALKTVQTSDAFREVFGDEAMGDRVRILVFGQYDNTWVLTPVLQFIDNYWNNGFVPEGKTSNVAEPRPVNYFIWGGGGATYYANSNPTGKMENSPFRNGSFEEAAVNPGAVAVAPADAAWEFEGPAGVVNTAYDRAPTLRRENVAPETAGKAQWRGVKFTVGEKDLYVTEMGRLMFPSDKEQRGTVGLFDAEGKAIHNYRLGGVRVQSHQGKKLPAGGEYRYGSLGHRLASGQSMSTVAKLGAGKTYYLLTQEPAGALTTGVHPVSADPAIQIEGAAAADMTGKDGEPGAIEMLQEGAFASGGADMHFKAGGFGIAETTGMPPLAEKNTGLDGEKALIMAPGGIARQKVNFPQAGTYALNWVAGTKIFGDRSQVLPQIDLYLDGGKVGETMPADFPGLAAGSSETFRIEKPGTHTLELHAVPPPSATSVVNTPVFMDRINLASIQAFFGLPGYTTFPNSGDADGEIKKDWFVRNVNAVNMIRCYGLESSSYEGGWALGGDLIRSPFMRFVNFRAPEAAGAEEKMLDIWTTLGGWDFQRHYAQVPEGDEEAAAVGESFPLVRGVINHNKRLPLLPGTGGILPAHVPQNGILLPGTLTPSNYTFAMGIDARGEWSNSPAKAPVARLTTQFTPEEKEMRWISWNVIAPQSGEYTVTIDTGEGGRFELFQRGSQRFAGAASGQPATAKLFLTKGLHTLNLKCLEGAYDLRQIGVAKN